MTTRTYQIPIYGGRLYVTKSLDAFNTAYKRYLLATGEEAIETGMSNAMDGGATAGEVVGGELRIVSSVWLRPGASRGSVLCHEAVHCAQTVARHIGMDPVEENEAFAYLTQWFYQKVGA
jgi:hypothetical protein